MRLHKYMIRAYHGGLSRTKKGDRPKFILRQSPDISPSHKATSSLCYLHRYSLASVLHNFDNVHSVRN